MEKINTHNEIRSLRRISICSCGFPVLKESINIGHMYLVDLESVRKGFNFFCGGCKTWYNDITVINAQSGKKEMAPLPYDLFRD
jgi:hypothetical protein